MIYCIHHTKNIKNINTLFRIHLIIFRYLKLHHNKLFKEKTHLDNQRAKGLIKGILKNLLQNINFSQNTVSSNPYKNYYRLILRKFKKSIFQVEGKGFSQEE
jgi:hypothetical protein